MAHDSSSDTGASVCAVCHQPFTDIRQRAPVSGTSGQLICTICARHIREQCTPAGFAHKRQVLEEFVRARKRPGRPGQWYVSNSVPRRVGTEAGALRVG